MTTDTIRERAEIPKDFPEAYTRALGHILRFNEDGANHGLNTVFRLAQGFTTDDNVWNSIQDDLAVPRTKGLLYGDYLSNSTYPWIRDFDVVSMVVNHAELLGEDPEAIANFVERTQEAYGTRPEPQVLRLVR